MVDKKDKNETQKKVSVKHFFFKSEDLIPDNMAYSYFKNNHIVNVVLNTMFNNKQMELKGTIIAMDQYHIVIEAYDKEREKKGLEKEKIIVYKHNISYLRKADEEDLKK